MIINNCIPVQYFIYLLQNFKKYPAFSIEVLEMIKKHNFLYCKPAIYSIIFMY